MGELLVYMQPVPVTCKFLQRMTNFSLPHRPDTFVPVGLQTLSSYSEATFYLLPPPAHRGNKILYLILTWCHSRDLRSGGRSLMPKGHQAPLA